MSAEWAYVCPSPSDWKCSGPRLVSRKRRTSNKGQGSQPEIDACLPASSYRLQHDQAFDLQAASQVLPALQRLCSNRSASLKAFVLDDIVCSCCIHTCVTNMLHLKVCDQADMLLLRNTGRRTDIDSVSSILRWMQAPPQDADATEVQTCCLLLLGQWVTGELYRPLSKAADIHAFAHACQKAAAGQLQTQKSTSWRCVLCCLCKLVPL